jgi:hypothetical protein
MSDLIDSLREEADFVHDDHPVMAEFLRRCADRIAELEAENKNLLSWLKGGDDE